MIYPTIGIPFMGSSPLCRYMQYKYSRCLRRAGGTVQILTPGTDPSQATELLSQCVGFLFPGGPDIYPKLYGKEPESGCKRPDRIRDAFEISLLQGALAARRPLFCIGRGMQLLNVVFGGTLTQDIRLKQEYPHRDLWNRNFATHPVTLDPDSLVSQILSTDAVTVNSLHHQVADIIGDGLWIAADSPEGFPEVLEIDDYPFCIAVQWHPEFMALTTPVQQRLFDAFVEACR